MNIPTNTTWTQYNVVWLSTSCLFARLLRTRAISIYVMDTNHAKDYENNTSVSYTWMTALLIIWMTLAVKVTLGVRLIRMSTVLPLLLLLLIDWWLEDTQNKVLTGRYDPCDLPTLSEESLLFTAIHPTAKTTTLEIKSWIPLASPPSWTTT